MRLPKPQSAPGLLIWAITIAFGIVAGNVLYVLIGQNIENVSAEKGFDTLLSRHWPDIMAWWAENGFWLALTFAFFFGATLALWINVGLQAWGANKKSDSKQTDNESVVQETPISEIATNVPLSGPNLELEEANEKIGFLQSQIDEMKQKQKIQNDTKRSLAEIDILQAAIIDRTPYCLRTAEQVRLKFTSIMADIDNAQKSELTSVQDRPMQALRMLLNEWRSSVSEVYMDFPNESDLARETLDFSAFTNDPFVRAVDEPDGLSQVLQGEYRKFAAQRKNLGRITARLQQEFDNEKRSLLEILND